jgi:hypothetical protein
MNCGVRIVWSPFFRERFAGNPVKSASFTCDGVSVRGEAVVTAEGLEGGAIYALSGRIRERLKRSGRTRIEIDLAPDLTSEALEKRLARAQVASSERGRGKPSLANRLRKAGLSPVATALLRESTQNEDLAGEMNSLPGRIKSAQIEIIGLSSIHRAISSAGGVSWTSIETDYSLCCDRSTFVCGEMIDWEAPTGGYLLQACLATGRAAGRGAARYVTRQRADGAQGETSDAADHINS